ncbi:MAG: BrnT family toxin [Magnetococcus sp. YQC-5]
MGIVTRMEYEWDETKRLVNLTKHNLDFNIAKCVFENHDKITVLSSYPFEERWIDLANVQGRILVLVYTMRHAAVRVISLRPAKREERRLLHV